MPYRHAHNLLLQPINTHRYHISIRKLKSRRCYLCPVASQSVEGGVVCIMQTNYQAGPHVVSPSVIARHLTCRTGERVDLLGLVAGVYDVKHPSLRHMRKCTCGH